MIFLEPRRKIGFAYCKSSSFEPYRFRTLIALFLCVTWTCCSFASEVDEKAGESGDLYDLSFEELLKVRISNSAVRRLRLDGVSKTENPFETTVFASPLSVEVFERETIDARGLKDVAETVASMVGVLSGTSPGEPYSFSMRGFSRGSVAVLYDGVSIGSSILDMRPMTSNNLERIEIVKGPVQLQHGEGAAAGTVNLITIRPEINSQPFGQATVSFGSFGTSSLNFGYNAPLSGKAAYRLDLSRNASSGWVDNASSHSLSLNGSGLWKPTTDLAINFSLKYLADTLPAYWGTPLVSESVARMPKPVIDELEGDRVIDLATRFNNYNVSDSEIGSDSLWSKLDFAWHEGSPTEMKLSVYHFTADRKWRNSEFYNYDEVSGLVERDRLSVDHDREIFGAQFLFAHTGMLADYENAFSLKVDYSESRFNRIVGFDVSGPEDYVDRVDLYDPDGGLFGMVPKRTDGNDMENLSLVFSDQIALSKAIVLDLAWRQERIDLANERFEFSGVSRARSSLHESFNLSGSRIGLSYEFTDHFKAYTHHVEQHDPVRDDLSFYYDAANFLPSDVNQTEVGLKALFNEDQTELTLAYFKIEKTVGGQAFENAPNRVNQQESEGLELAVRAQVSETFTLGGNASFTHAKYGAFVDPLFGIDVSGNTPTNAPELMASLWGSVNEIGGLPLEIGGGVSYVSDRFADSSNTVKLNEYATLKLFASYALGSNYRISFHVRNLTDEVYAQWSDVNYPNQVSIDPPRSYELNVQYRF